MSRWNPGLKLLIFSVSVPEKFLYTLGTGGLRLAGGSSDATPALRYPKKNPIIITLDIYF